MLQRTSYCRKTGNEVYVKQLTVIHAEMDASLNYKDIGPRRIRKRNIWANLGGMTTCKNCGTMYDQAKGFM